MAELELIRRDEVPSGGFRYKQPETGYTITSPTWIDLLRDIKRHRKANNIPIGLNFNREVEQALAETLPKEFVQPYDPPEKWPLPYEDWPVWAKGFALLKNSEDQGVGDTVARLIGDFASEKFKAWHRKIFNQECGCHKRQAIWNSQYQY